MTLALFMTTSDPLRQQGLFFSALAWLVVLFTVAFPLGNTRLELLVLATLIFFLGIPHGALDVIFAKRLYRLVSPGRWAVFCAAYVMLAAAVVAVWWGWPAFFLTAFLLVSAFHFSGDPAAGTSVLLRFWYAPSMLIFPAWLHELEVARLFGALVAGDAAAQLASVLHSMGWPWCVGLAVTLMLQWRRNWVTGLEVMSVSLLALAAPPLLSFTVFFCVMHSARHALRTRAFAPDLAWSDLFKKAIAPMAVCALGGWLLWPALKDMPVDTAVVRVLFVALAALTVPHMVLIERVRWAGWRGSPVRSA